MTYQALQWMGTGGNAGTEALPKWLPRQMGAVRTLCVRGPDSRARSPPSGVRVRSLSQGLMGRLVRVHSCKPGLGAPFPPKGNCLCGGSR